MIISINNQALILLASVYGGMLIGLLFDLFRLIRRNGKCKGANTFVGDMIFWTISLVIILIIVYNSSSGQIRPYQLAGLTLGAAAYLRLLSKYVMSILMLILIGLRTLIYAMIGILKGPIVFASNLFWKPYKCFKEILVGAVTKAVNRITKYIVMHRQKK
jgi:spore cortex biosynthesis protein YabQ